MEAFSPFEQEVMILCITTMMKLPLVESQCHQLLQFNELDDL
jgi:hypothetical protein